MSGKVIYGISRYNSSRHKYSSAEGPRAWSEWAWSEDHGCHYRWALEDGMFDNHTQIRRIRQVIDPLVTGKVQESTFMSMQNPIVPQSTLRITRLQKRLHQQKYRRMVWIIPVPSMIIPKLKHRNILLVTWTHKHSENLQWFVASHKSSRITLTMLFYSTTAKAPRLKHQTACFESRAGQQVRIDDVLFDTGWT